MNKSWDIMTLLLFPAIFIVFLLFLIILIYIYAKKDKRASKYIYGFFTGLSKRKCFALSLLIFNFYFLSFVLVMKLELTYLIIVISLMFILISGLLTSFSFNWGVNLLLNIVNLSLIYLANIVNVLRQGSSEVIFYILQILMNFFGILFFLFTSLKFIKNIYRKGEIKWQK